MIRKYEDGKYWRAGSKVRLNGGWKDNLEEGTVYIRLPTTVIETMDDKCYAIVVKIEVLVDEVEDKKSAKIRSDKYSRFWEKQVCPHCKNTGYITKTVFGNTGTIQERCKYCNPKSFPM